MTPRERVAKAMKGQKPDLLPIMVANSNTFICQYYGQTVPQFLTDPDLCTEGNVRFTREFEVDYNLCINGYILYGCGPELGCEWKYAGENFPGFISGPLKSEEDLTGIEVPSKPSGYFAFYLEVIRRVNRALGDRYHLAVSILGPFAVACFLRGIEEALLDTIVNRGFFKRYMEVCTKLSVFFGRQVLDTGLRNPILNEIFLTPDMIRPDTYHELIAPYDREVQRILGPENVPNSLAAFMGRPGDKESQKGGAALYKVFYGGAESMDSLKQAMALRLPGLPFPVAVSGPALDSKSGEEIVAYLRSTLDFLVKEQGLYPSILLSSVQAETPEKAKAIAEKIKMINRLRYEYRL
ncbi:MAG: uroporphyrinogen decarboxylase family protein [Thermodesulfobacteriota bacterium]